ncbi:MAG: hypothetical protein AAF441_18130 [Pseudomonadota bacterium]
MGIAAKAELVSGRGGRSGFRYVLSFSEPLSPDLQAALTLHSTGFESRLRTDEAAAERRNKTYEIIAPLLALKPYSREMAQAVRDVAATSGKTENWIHGKLRAYRENGMAGLGTRKRVDTGERRVLMSRSFDKAATEAGLSQETIAEIARSMGLYIAGLFKAGEAFALIRRHANRKLKQLSHEAGFDPGEADADRVCRVPDNFINRGKPLKAVNRLKADRRGYEDIKPRIRRTTAGLLPGEILMADATKLDIAMQREDGTVYFPHCLAWMDLATRFVWVHLYFPEKGKGLTNQISIESFLDVVHSLGLPKMIYADNGSEYNFTGLIDDALKLADDRGQPLVRFNLLGSPQRKSNTVNSIPYNPQGKAQIEGWFGVLRHYLKSLPGHVGGNRMKMRTPNVNRQPVPFAGTPAQLNDVVAQAVALRNTQPQSGELKGLSPRDAWQKAIDAGWQRTDADPDALRIAFSREVTRVVRQGTFRHGNRTWTCPELQTFHESTVTVREPKYGTWSRLPVFVDDKLLGVAVPDEVFDVLDPEGAREAQRRQKAHRDSLRQLDKSVPDLDVIAERDATLAGVNPMPTAPIYRTVYAVPKMQETIDALRETPEDRARRRQDAWEREIDERQALLDEARRRRERNG